MGRAQKLKQQRKEEEERRRLEKRKEARRTAIMVLASLFTVAATVGLIMLVNQLKKDEERKATEPKITQELVLETSKGEIVIGLYSEDTPLTVQHVADLAGRGF